MEVQELLTYPTWERYTVLSQAIRHLSLAERRTILNNVRSLPSPMEDQSSSITALGDLFLPRRGFTVSEFSVWHTCDTKKGIT